MNEQIYQNAVSHALKIMDKNLDVFIREYPHVSENNVYSPERNCLWTSSFHPGMCFLAFELTGDETYLKHCDAYLDSFEERLEKRIGINHDLGFLYTLSCVANYKLTGSEWARAIALQAADVLAERYNKKGCYIQAWGEMGISYPNVKIIIDAMLNLPLLYWTEDERLFKIAENHAHTSASYLIRPDYSSFHTYLMNPETGEAVIGKTHQGYADKSTWARGQAWAVYGGPMSRKSTN